MELLLYTSFDLPIIKFIGFVFFLITFISGFWCIFYLAGFVSYWLTFGAAENLDKINTNIDPETIRRKKLTEIEGIQIVYQKK